MDKYSADIHAAELVLKDEHNPLMTLTAQSLLADLKESREEIRHLRVERTNLILAQLVDDLESERFYLEDLPTSMVESLRKLVS